MIMVSAGVNVRDWHAVLGEIRRNFDPHGDFVMIPKVPLDTLDFTSYKMNLGSKMILDATKKNRPQQETSNRDREISRLREEISGLGSLDRRILQAHLVDETLLLVKIDTPLHSPAPDSQARPAGPEILRMLVGREALQQVKMIACVSSDVDIHDKESYIWGIFTRFDCERDVIFTENKLIGISPSYRGILGIDATWKPGYPEPLVMDEAIVRRVDEKWGKIWQ